MSNFDLLTANDRAGEHAPSWYVATASPPRGFLPLAGETEGS
jgi:hypothetical protein